MRTRALLFLLAVGLAACGGAAADEGDEVASLSDTSTTAPVEEELDSEEAAIAFTECMRENGVEMGDPTVDADGNVMPGLPTDLPDIEDADEPVRVDGALGEEMQGAFEECGDLLEGTAFGFTRGDQTELQDELLDLAQCLRDQGLDVADPDLSAGADEGAGPGAGPFGIDFEDPEVQAALEVCEEFMPNFGGPAGEIRSPGDNGE
ncbi:MAG TPA: hypothetical protein VFZ15_09530 [Acidimicrobiia bacterium]|nr:hypothetical protein [Acidimicrobiia bacterium]